MAQTTSFFWTDAEQAEQRLSASHILYDDVPVFVTSVRAGADGVPKATIHDHTGTESRPRLDDPKFGKFRSLPRLGWMNYRQPTKSKSTALFLNRLVKNTRTHGLNSGNVRVQNFVEGREFDIAPGLYNFDRIGLTESFLECHKGVYPSLAATLENISEGDGIAYSRNYLVYADLMGLKWLYRGLDRIGLITGNDTLNLFQKSSFYREEIMEDPCFTLTNIREL